METMVRLRRGTRPRTVTIAVIASLVEAVPDAASRAFEVFTRGLDAGLSAADRVRVESASVIEHEQHGLFVETWVAAFPRVSPGAFAILERMAAASIPGVRRLEIREQADERLLLVRSFERDDEATIAEVPWQVAFVRAPEAEVRIEFAEPLTPPTVKLAATVLQAWADVLAFGGFAGPDGLGASSGIVSRVDASGERELALGFAGIACGHDAWEALFEGLLPVSEQAAIRLVEIRGGAAD